MSDPPDNEAPVFEVELRCAACQGVIDDADAVVCPECSSEHHVLCWAAEGRCRSYHCDAATKAKPGAPAEIVITAEETEHAVVPPPRPRVTSAQVAARYVPVEAGVSRFAVISLGVSLAVLAGSLIVFWAGRQVQVPFRWVGLLALFGLFGSAAAGVMSAIAAGSARTRRQRGTPLALVGVVCAVLGAALSVGALLAFEGPYGKPASFELEAPSPPALETFDGAPEAIRNAMRANVFIAGRAGPGSSSTWCGAGVVIGERDGETYILTNQHVVAPSAGPGELSATFITGEDAAARVEWTGEDGLDLAVLSTRPARPVGVLTRIRRSPVRISERLFAIGNPHNLSWTYTEGAASRIHQRHTREGAALTVIQTQTPIQQGNSGGGLYDGAGLLVGINTWTVDGGGPSEPGFAISAQTVLGHLPARFAVLAGAVPESEAL